MKTKKDEYLYLLLITTGVAAMWERGILFHVVGIAIVLCFYFIVLNREPLRKNFISYFLCTFISGLILFPINILALNPEFQTVPSSHALRSISDFDLTKVFSPSFFDYILRAEIEMGIVGWFCYFALIILLFLGVIKRDLNLCSIFILFNTSYIPYIMDMGWIHNEDRFIAPILGLLSISLYLVLFLVIISLLKYSSSISSRTCIVLARKSISVGEIPIIGITGFIIGIILFSGTLTAINAQNRLLNEGYIPLDTMSDHIADITTENDKVYYWALATPLWFYFEKHHVKAGIVAWEVWTDVPYQTIDNMLSYFKSKGITYFIFSDPYSWKLCGLFNKTMVQNLIDNPHTNEYTLICEKKTGINSLFLWKVL